MLNKKLNVLIRGYNKVLRFPFSGRGTSLPGPGYTKGANSI